MQLVISSFGSYIHKKNEAFVIKIDGKVSEIPITRVESIWITNAATISTDVIQAALENNIDIVFLDKFGNPYGRIWHPKIGSTTLIRRRQLEVSLDERGLILITEWLEKKMQNQINLLKRLKHTRKDMAGDFNHNIERIEKLKAELLGLDGLVDEIRNRILGIEGMAAVIYFESISAALPEEWRFHERSRHPAKDEFNSALNYGYGVLYSMVERSCILAGLDPYVGILHTDGYNKKSFVFDFIEMFRTYVDETVVFLFTKRKLHKEHFEPFEGGVGITKDGKTILMQDLNAQFDKKIPYRGKQVQVRNMLMSECHSVANRLIKGGV